MASEAALNELKQRLRGRLILPADDGYDDARKVYNAMIDRRPAYIVQCVDVADVIAAVRFGHEAGLDVAIRGGGHSGPGLGIVDDGLVIDLGCIRFTRVDPAAATVRVGGGCKWGDVDHATHPFGLATPSGMISTTGVGGLTLGGGIGYLARRYGLTIDNLLSADVVLADGRFVTASNDEHPDLFWALRGGGGNFGVVTSFQFRLQPVSTIHGGPMLWPFERAEEVLRMWQDYIRNAPEEISGWYGLMTVPPGPPFPPEYHLKKVCAIVWCDTGPKDQAESRLAAIRKKFGAPAIDFAGPMPFPTLQTMFDALMPPGLQWYWKADFFKGYNEEAIRRHIEHAAKLPTPLSAMHIYPINGAVQRVSSRDTAFSFRDASFAQVIVGIDPDPASKQRLIAWARDYWQALHPYSAGGAYVNMVMDEGQDYVRSAYRENYDRLARIKKEYDPTNFFHVNQNIKPA